MTDSKTKYPAHDMISRKTRNYKSHIIHSIIGDIDCGKLEDEFSGLLAENERYKAALERLLEDTQHSEHKCGDIDCPVELAKQALKGAAGVE